MNVYVISDGTPQKLEQVRCRDEGEELQSVLERNPNLLPGDQIDPDDPRRWLVVKREMPVPDPGSGADRWSLDLLLADQDAVPTLVECKRFDDPRARREVVAQMLDYAANGGQYWKKDRLLSMASETARRQGRDLETALRDLNPADGATSPDAFFDRFVAKLKEGEVRIIFFLEESSHDLRSIADFLNRQMIRTEVLVVEARQYEHGGARIIVPVLIGYTDQIRRIKETVTVSPVSEKVLWTKDRLIENARQNVPEEFEVVEALITAFDGLGLKARGFRSGVNFGLDIGGDYVALVYLSPRNIWLSVTRNGYSKLTPETFTNWKSNVNQVARFYREEALSEPSNRGALGPHYNVLRGRVEAFVNAISAIKTAIEKAFANSA